MKHVLAIIKTETKMSEPESITVITKVALFIFIIFGFLRKDILQIPDFSKL